MREIRHRSPVISTFTLFLPNLSWPFLVPRWFYPNLYSSFVNSHVILKLKSLKTDFLNPWPGAYDTKELYLPWTRIYYTRSNKLAADFPWLEQIVTSFWAMSQCPVGEWHAKSLQSMRYLKILTCTLPDMLTFPCGIGQKKRVVPAMMTTLGQALGQVLWKMCHLI